MNRRARGGRMSLRSSSYKVMVLFLTYFVFIPYVVAGTLNGPIEFFFSPQPDAQQPIVDAIDGAKKSIKMKMFHMSNPTIASAMMFAAKRGVDVKIIFDKGQWKKPNDVKLVEDMKAAGVQIFQASTGFSITHEKSMIVDNKKAMVSTMNETRAFMKMLDFGVFVYDRSVVDEMNKVFQADLDNSSNNEKNTPQLDNDFLVWSPVNSHDRIVNLIASAKREIQLIVENLGNADVQNALIDAAQRGVAVQVLVPLCNLTKLNLNYPYVQALRSAKVDAKMVPGTGTEEIPYVHAKSIVVDNNQVFLGSENFSNNSLLYAREVGIILNDSDLANKVQSLFYNLWPKAQLPPADANYSCASAGTGTGDSGSERTINSLISFDILN